MSKNSVNKSVKRWNVPVPEHLDIQLEEYISKDGFKTKSEFIRTAVRDRLEEERKKMTIAAGMES